VLILKGKQGAGKSSFFRTIVGEEFFTDSFSLPANGEVGHRQLQTIHKFAAIELAELGKRITGRYEASDAVKAFLSATRDDFIPMYGRTMESHERGFIFAGSVNDEAGFLSDATGNRRFQIIPILNDQSSPIDLGRLRQERDSILLAAVLAYQAGEPLFLPKELAVSAEEANTAYIQEVGMLEKAMCWAALRDNFAGIEAWTEVFEGDPRDYDLHKGRVGRTFAQVPWVKAGQKIRTVEGRRINGYVVDHKLRGEMKFRAEVAELARYKSLPLPEEGKEAEFLEEIF
jgi:predicted P-loop ATPase